MTNKKKPFISLKVKAAIVAFVAGAIIISLSNYYFFGRAEKALYNYTLERMDALSEMFASNASQGNLLHNRAIAEKLCYSINREPDVIFALIFDRQKNILAGNYGGFPSKYFSYIRQTITTDEANLDSNGYPTEKDPFDGNEILIRPIYSTLMSQTVGGGLVDSSEAHDKRVLGYSVIVFSFENLTQQIQKTRSAILWASILMLLAIIACFYGLVSILVGKLETLLVAAKKLGGGDLSARVDIHSHDEIRQLGDGFNAMANEIQAKTKELKGAMERIKHASLETIYRLSLAAEYRDWDTGHHLLRMSHYSKAIARHMKLDGKYTEAILYAALMHDVGKIGIPDHILQKPGRLSPEEWEVMKRHTVIGAQILEKSQAEFMKLAENIALTHHEKWDGSGYPNGLKGEEISLAGRIVAVADVFEAVTSKRPYKEPFPLEVAFKIIKEGTGTHFDPTVVDAFFSIKDEILLIKTMKFSADEHRINGD